MSEEYVEFELWQDGIMVAGVSGPRERAEAEIRHYALVYGQDGPVEIRLSPTPQEDEDATR